MRTPIAMTSIALLLLTACSTSFRLDRPLDIGKGDWLQMGGDAGRTHAISEDSPSIPVTVRDGIVWSFGLDGPAAKAAALLADDAVIFSSTTGYAEAVEAASGERIGVFPCKWFIHATPAVADGCLFVATNGIEPLLLCFDLREQRIRYEAAIPSVHAAVCAVGKRVIIAARDGEVRAYAARDTVPLWSTRLEGTITAAPAATDSVVVVAGQNGDLTALAASDGRKLWRLPAGSPFLAGPSIHGGTVAAANYAGVLTAVDIASGERRWSVDCGVPVYQGLAWHGDTIAAALSSGELVLFRASDGTEYRRISTGELPGAAPLFDGGGIMLLQRRGVLVRIDPRSGEITEIAKLETRSETPPLLTPYGIVLVDEEGEAVCIPREK